MTQQKEYGIVLVCCDESYWLLEGDEHLSAMLAGEENYPKPVKMITYASSYDLQIGLPEGISIGKLWSIHPGIIGRLRREKDIIEEEK